MASVKREVAQLRETNEQLRMQMSVLDTQSKAAHGSKTFIVVVLLSFDYSLFCVTTVCNKAKYEDNVCNWSSVYVMLEHV